MQRRAAALYAAFFVLLAAGSYGMIATANSPDIELSESTVDIEASQGEEITVDGTTYQVASFETSEAEEGGEISITATLERNVTVEQRRTLENGSTIERDGTNWSVSVPDSDDPARFRLVEQFSIDRETTELNGTTYVVFDDGENRTLVPRDRYIRERYGEPETREFREGEDWNDTRTVGNVTSDGATLTYNETETEETILEEGVVVTLGETEFIAHFPDRTTVQLTSDTDAYADAQADIGRFKTQVNGLWAVTILSGSLAGLVIAMAYLPKKQT